MGIRVPDMEAERDVKDEEPEPASLPATICDAIDRKRSRPESQLADYDNLTVWEVVMLNKPTASKKKRIRMQDVKPEDSALKSLRDSGVSGELLALLTDEKPVTADLGTNDADSLDAILNSDLGSIETEWGELDLRAGLEVTEVTDCHAKLPPFRDAYKHTRARKWSCEETEKFYEALSRVGEDLLMVSSFFPNVTHKDIVRKYHAECRRNRSRIDQALMLRAPMLTVAEYEDQRGHEVDLAKIDRNRALLANDEPPMDLELAYITSGYEAPIENEIRNTDSDSCNGFHVNVFEELFEAPSEF